MIEPIVPLNILPETCAHPGFGIIDWVILLLTLGLMIFSTIVYTAGLLSRRYLHHHTWIYRTQMAAAIGVRFSIIGLGFGLVILLMTLFDVFPAVTACSRLT